MSVKASEAGPQMSAGQLRRLWSQTPHSFRIGFVILLAHAIVAATGPFWAPYGLAQLGTGMPLSGMSWAHPFGVDQLGRDVFSRVVHGGHTVILLSLSGTALGLVVGSTLGLLSAYVGGWFDEILQRFLEALISIPFLVLALISGWLGFQGFAQAADTAGKILIGVFLILFLWGIVIRVFKKK